MATIGALMQQRQDILTLLKMELGKAQNRIKQMANRRRREREFTEGEEVYLKLSYPHLRALSQQPVSKLSPKFYGPFPVLARVGQVAYHLQLPKGSQIHPVFHVSLLKKGVGTQVASPSLPPNLREEADLVTPTTILDRRIIYKQGAPIT